MEKDLGYQITVSDDGPGFDTRILQSEDFYGRESAGTIKVNGRSHVGLKAARHRLEHFCGGKLTVQSEESIGTTVTIWIPYAFSENADSRK